CGLILDLSGDRELREEPAPEVTTDATGFEAGVDAAADAPEDAPADVGAEPCAHRLCDDFERGWLPDWSRQDEPNAYLGLTTAQSSSPSHALEATCKPPADAGLPTPIAFDYLALAPDKPSRLHARVFVAASDLGETHLLTLGFAGGALDLVAKG